jgi:hypothetical protein
VSVAAAAALVMVPIVGAAERPLGWATAAIASLAILAVFVWWGRAGLLGALLLVAGVLGVAWTRGLPPAIGPAAFVALVLLSTLWLSNREDGRRRRNAERENRSAQKLAGRGGELQVAGVLAKELPDDFVVLNGVALPRGLGDVDHVVVGPSGLFLLETKTMAGRIVCRADGTWQRTRIGRGGTSYVAFIGDPAAQVLRNVHAARDCLRRRLPHLFGRPGLWLEGLLVFPHPRTELETAYSRVPAVRLDELSRRIRDHQPRRRLESAEVDAICEVLVSEAHGRTLARSAQALVEMALVLPIVLALVLGTVALSRVVQAQTAIVAVAHEVARAGALGSTRTDALERMRARVAEVTPGLGLDSRLLEMRPDVSEFGRVDGRVVANVTYRIDLREVPVFGWAPPPVIHAQHIEWIDPYRGGIDDPGTETP